MTDNGIKAIRDFVVATVLRVAGLLVALLVLVRVLIPWLIDAHNDAYLAAAIVLAIATPVLMIVVGMQLALDFRRFPAKFHKAEEEGSSQ